MPIKRHVALFLLTFLSALLSQVSLFEDEGPWALMKVPLTDPGRLLMGLPFAASLMAILLAHEMGHWLCAHRFGLKQSLPYFLPAPTLFGTLGAVIVMREQPANKRVLLWVAVMGPFCGLALALPLALWGLMHAEVVGADSILGPEGQSALSLGNSLMFMGLEHISGLANANYIIHPVGLAGWAGLFFTSLNLMPAAQLDGGHVVYALCGARHLIVSILVATALFGLGLFLSFVGPVFGLEGGAQGGAMWFIWALLLFVMGIGHPNVADESNALGHKERVVAFLALALFVALFVPVPLQMHTTMSTAPQPTMGAPFDEPSNERFEHPQLPFYDDKSAPDDDGDVDDEQSMPIYRL